MFLHQASLIPSTIALLDFFNSSFPNFFWYPYWYLGNPFNYLIGPVLPFSSLFLNRIFGFTPEQSFWLVFILSYLVGNIGLYLFSKKLGATNLFGLALVAINILLPFSYIMINFQNGLGHISFFSLPFVLYIFVDFLKKNSHFFDLLLILSISFLLLIDISVIVPIIIGFLSLIIVLKSPRVWMETILKVTLVLFASLFLSTTWYTLGFLQTLILNPSFGGQPLINVLKLIFDLSLRIIPIIVAVWVVKKGKLKLNNLTFFGLLFFFSFGFLTILRFVSDPDFVLDWISYTKELQLGISFIIISVFFSLKFNKKVSLLILICIVSLLGWVKFYNLIHDLNSNKFKIEVLNLIQDGSRSNYFFSGSTVFWINQYKNLTQLRGGNDGVTIHPTWAMASYQIREGNSLETSKMWMEALGIRTYLVHNKDSKDFFLDFKNSQKFETPYPIANSNGNILNGSGGPIEAINMARVTDNSIFSVKRPKNGEDNLRLREYIDTLQEGVKIEKRANRVILSRIPKAKKVISIAQTYHQNWRSENPDIKVTEDSLGNTVLVSKSSFAEIIKIEYNPSLFSHVFSLLLFTIMLYLIFKFNLIAKFIFKKISLD